jgi:hypothetical protein
LKWLGREDLQRRGRLVTSDAVPLKPTDREPGAKDAAPAGGRLAAVRDGYILAASLWCFAIALGLVDAASDAKGWWMLPLPDPYLIHDYNALRGFWFTPPIAAVFYAFTLLPLTVFLAVWTGLQFLALGLMVGRWSALALLVPIIWWEISSGNIALFLGLAVWIGFRYPAAWSFVLLTKITPGIGLLWFVVRGEWRNLGIALGATALIAAVSYVVAPGLWTEWFDRLTSNVGKEGPGFFTIPIPLGARLVLAAIIVIWGARTNRRWTVVVATTFGAPTLWYNALATLAAVMPLVDWSAVRESLRRQRHPLAA